LEVRTYREGLAQKVGHDLIMDVGRWEATVEIPENGVPTSIRLDVDPHSLSVREGLHGAKALTDKDRADIRTAIDEKILRGHPITFRSGTLEGKGGRITVGGELTIAGTTRPAGFEVDLATDGRLRGTLVVTQSEWGIKPYRAFMGALKVRDAVEIVVDVPLDLSPQ
jgi:polyisoprenoid-binding protein YceI